jgi:ribosomal-protein-alanine N-acetyltransferase
MANRHSSTLAIKRKPLLIRTGHFTIRPYRPGDLPSLVRHINDKEIVRYMLSVPHPYTEKHGKAWIRMTRNAARRKNRTSIEYAIEIDGEVAGGGGIMNIHDHKAEIGYWLGRRHWGKGIMTRVVKEITKYGFNELGLRRIYARTMIANKASKRVLEKAGFKYEATMRKSEKKRRRLIDVYLYAKVR